MGLENDTVANVTEFDCVIHGDCEYEQEVAVPQLGIYIGIGVGVFVLLLGVGMAYGLRRQAERRRQRKEGFRMNAVREYCRELPLGLVADTSLTSGVSTDRSQPATPLKGVLVHRSDEKPDGGSFSSLVEGEETHEATLTIPSLRYSRRLPVSPLNEITPRGGGYSFDSPRATSSPAVSAGRGRDSAVAPPLRAERQVSNVTSIVSAVSPSNQRHRGLASPARRPSSLGGAGACAWCAEGTRANLRCSVCGPMCDSCALRKHTPLSPEALEAHVVTRYAPPRRGPTAKLSLSM
eukprot:TRINITY_DN8447_c0_g1_i1.p1 TRINITY_DN8447_c0_g1~~TRINITY_DN8447_c0_g1_i1.p1  ORF type:complete len:293 (+),score=38.12 TRINITY_DN8447_c0_g1_i1:105-983(+)